MATIHAAAFTQSRPWSKTEFAELLASPHVFASTDNHGFAIGRAIAGEAELLTIAVDPAEQGMGLGRRILEDFLTAARQNGADTVFLEVAEDNTPALALYRAAGLQTTATRKGYYARSGGKSVNAFIMVQKLT
nr:ribosomal protein S18-alanine N-acetyltransferase [Shimia biformata]